MATTARRPTHEGLGGIAMQHALDEARVGLVEFEPTLMLQALREEHECNDVLVTLGLGELRPCAASPLSKSKAAKHTWAIKPSTRARS